MTTRAATAPSLEQLAHAIDPGPTDIVFVSGSRLEGLGNDRSDYDMYVVQSEGFVGVPFITVVLDGNYVVYEMFSYPHAVRVAETINGTAPRDFRAVWSLSWFELEFYYRVVIGRGLVNEEAFAALKRRFRKEAIDACIHAWCGLRAVVHLEEARRKLAIGKIRGAYTSAQQAAAAAVDSFLATRGESYTGFKWRFEKLRRCVGESHDVWRRFWALKSLGARTIPDYLDEVSAFCRDIGMEQFGTWSADEVVYKPADTARLVRLRGVPYIVENRHALFSLSEPGQRVWSWIDGSTTRGELMSRAEAEAGMSEQEADAFIFALAEQGLIRR